MRLYFKPGACSLASRITLIGAGAAFEAVKVDTEAGLTETGASYRAINPKGYVPAIELPDGAVVTENPAVLQYLADAHPAAGLAPAAGTLERTRLQEWLNFTSSELHKAFAPYFSGQALSPADKEQADQCLARRIGDVAHGLADGRRYILGDAFSVADAYLFVVLNWTGFIGFSLDSWPLVKAYCQRVSALSAVREAMRQEGLLGQEEPA